MISSLYRVSISVDNYDEINMVKEHYLYFVVPGLFFEDDFINFLTGFGIKTFQKVDSPHTRNFPCTQKEANNRSGPLRTQLVVANQFFRHPISSDFD